MSSKKAIVKKIVLEVNGRELSLSVEDAKALRAALDEVLGKTIEKPVYYPTPYVQPYVYPPVWYTTCQDSPATSSTTITCTSPTAYLSQ